MTTVTPVIPSGSTDGAPVKVAATGTVGTTFHTCVSGTASFDEVYMWATNTSSSDVLLTVELGDATAPDHNVKMTIPANDIALVLGGVRLNNAKTVKAFAGTINVINMFGNINRYA